MTTLYIEPFSGMAGDMFLAALLDLGDPRFALDDLRALADQLVPGESRITLESVWRQNLSGKMLTVHTPESHPAPGHAPSPATGPANRPPHRRHADIERIVRSADLPADVQDRALRVFWRIAVAEGRVHGCAPEEIHFHEVGAVDTIVDVCGACFALQRLGIEQVFSSAPLTGTGTVMCAHGEMPVPAPAVAELMRGRTISIGGGGGERLTPTGAALLAELTATFEPPRSFAPQRIGYGAGHRDPQVGPPNVLRVQLGTEGAESAGPEAWLVEVNLDDMTGEELAHAAEALRAGGALDVWTTAAQMKKGRPGVVLSALCRIGARPRLEAALFEHTSTLGMRWRECQRTECARRTIEVDLEGVPVRVKVRERPRYDGASPFGERDLSPEHDDLAALAQKSGLSLRELERRAIAAALALLSSGRGR